MVEPEKEAHRRRRGSGSIYQIGTGKSKGYWRGAIMINGKRHVVTNKSRGEVESKLERLKLSISLREATVRLAIPFELIIDKLYTGSSPYNIFEPSCYIIFDRSCNPIYVGSSTSNKRGVFGRIARRYEILGNEIGFFLIESFPEKDIAEWRENFLLRELDPKYNDICSLAKARAWIDYINQKESLVA